ncbi:MAG: helix-turn-helix transcriptional regulator [Acutalibacteraceae bacterium]|nr:helix-turn-helix transcriptional regulator [Acutalibacteraceae bacterium]HIR02492.1 helix-turn-helix transcriptional regulator [Candidatus Scatovicinus merdipullorum]
MEQIKIGRFIAEARKAQGLTQRQLADTLSISDKTVSKWECGKGLPEVSLMMPLCNTLNVTVNDLLSGERVSEADYQKKAEDNMMDLMKENEENKKRMALSVICGVITIIAVCSLTVIASYIELPMLARIALIVLAGATAVAGIGAAAMLEVKAGYYECPHCKALFVPTMGEYVKGYHTFTKRKLTCPECGKNGMCKHRIVR